jgi:hypothetical protein
MTSMPDPVSIPELDFPNVARGKNDNSWDIKRLLYQGGAGVFTRYINSMIKEGHLGAPLLDRLELVKKIHEVINGKLVGGGSVYSAGNQIRFVRDLFNWAEQTGHQINLDSIQTVFLQWTDSLVHRHQVIKDLSPRSAYTMGAQTGYVLDGVLNRSIPLIATTRLRLPPRRKTARGVKAEKQSLFETFAFGHFLQDICDALTADVVLKGALPVRIPLRSGGELVEWSGCHDWRSVQHHLENEPGVSKKGRAKRNHRKSLQSFRKRESEGTLKTRYPLANKRCQAELLMFIGQTGMNLSQAHKLKLRNFYYASYLDGYLVRDRKGRRGGDVLFEIFKEYKPHFERYLEWRRTLFPDSDELFPLIRRGGRDVFRHPQFSLRAVCKNLGVRFVPPQELRNTRVNWLLRRSGDVDLTAGMVQHTKGTLLSIYERPSQQRAMSEITRFWAKHDPTTVRTTPPAPGECNGRPVPAKNLPKNATNPDCIRPSGCLWCEHHRDIDSQDYLWSLASFRHLKVIELSKWNAPQGNREMHPAQHTVDRISKKLYWFLSSNAKRKEWAEEAVARVEEGSYHPEWSRRIAAMEGLS